jgi:hypothetical protein
MPSVGMTPVKVTPEMASAKVEPSAIPAAPQAQDDTNQQTGQPDGQLPKAGDAQNDSGHGKADTGKVLPPPPMPTESGKQPAPPVSPATPGADKAGETAQGQGAAEQAEVKPGEMAGKWYNRSPAWEVFLQLGDDGSFIHSASRPNAVPVVIKGDWRLRSGYLVLHIKSFMVGKNDQMSLRKDNPYAMLKLIWKDDNTVVMDGDMPAPGSVVGGYLMHRAKYPDLNFIPAMSYLPSSTPPVFVGAGETDTSAAATTQPAPAATQAASQDEPQNKTETKPKPVEDPFATFNPNAN